MGLVQDIKKGWGTAVDYMSTVADRRHSIFDPRFNKAMREGYATGVDPNLNPYLPSGARRQPPTAPGISKPGEFLGAYSARLLTDVGTDSTRQFYWRYNHPLALAEKVIEQSVPALADIESPTKRAAITLGISAPVAASLGTFDITNPQELFRPKGYAQSYAEKGSEDRRKTAEPGMELFDRFFLGRRGQPLKYETAKQDIPDLTPERYKKALQSQYQDRGLLGLGLVKGTTENLQGYPEVRIVGFPVGLQATGALAGGTIAASQALAQKNLSTRAKAGITLAGSLAGALTGNLANRTIASLGNNPEKLPSTLEY